MAASADSDTAPAFTRLWHWFVPSTTQWLWLILLVVLLAQPWQTTMVSSDGDTCMHWRVGEYMLQTGHIIRKDVFSHTRFGWPIVSKEWLSEIAFAVAGRVAGLYGLVVVAALVIATTFAFLHHRLLQETGNHTVAILVAFIAAWAASAHWLARPHVFSFLMAALWGDALRRFERPQSARRLFMTLTGFTMLWVNLHGGYLAGFVTLGAYWLGAAMERDRRKFGTLTAVGLLCCGASLLNPDTYKLHVYNIRFLRSDFFKNWLAEYSSVRFGSPDALGFAVWLALVFLTLALCRPKLSPAAALVVIVWTYFALYAARNIPLMAIFTAPIIAAPLSEAKWVPWQALEIPLQVGHRSRGWPLAAATAVIAITCIPHPTAMSADRWPAAAVEFIQRHPERFTGNMFNQYAWGGYLMEVLPEYKVFVDGRTDFYGEQLLEEFSDVTALHSNWTQILTKYDVAWTLMPADHRLNAALPLLGWQAIYTNNVTTIFRRPP